MKEFEALQDKTTTEATKDATDTGTGTGASDAGSNEFLTSSQAALRLGLSMATIQKLVDNNILQAWKTFGGHRRISLASVEDYQNTNRYSDRPRSGGDHRFQVMLVIEAPGLKATLAEEVTRIKAPVDTCFFESLTEAFLDLLGKKQDLLVLYMTTPRAQQLKSLEILQKFLKTRQSVGHVVVLTQERDLQLPNEAGQKTLPIQMVHEPLTPFWLTAYLAGFIAQRKA